MKKTVGWVLCLGVAVAVQAAGNSPATDSAWKSVEKILGHPGIVRGEDFQISFPRTDLNVVVDGIPVEPQLALTSWFRFSPLLKGTSVTGEMVLLDSEVPPVTARLLKEGFQMTGLAHTLLDESPGIKTLRLKGEGPRSRLAESLKVLLNLTGTPLKSSASPKDPGPEFQTPGQDWNLVQKILGPGEVEGNVLSYVFSPAGAGPSMEMFVRFQRIRGEVIRQQGPLNLGLQASKEAVVAAGRLVLTEGQAQGVLKELTESHITVTSAGEISVEGSRPMLLFYFWTEGDSEETASALKSVLDGISSGPAEPNSPQDSESQP